MNKTMWINVGKTTIFLFLFCIIMAKAYSILNYKSTGGGGGWQNFYNMEKESADVIFVGSSHAHCTFDHGLLWDKYGITGYTLSAGSQKIDAAYYFVKEAIEVQKPKIVVVEVWGAIGDQIVNSEESIYRNTFGMKWGSNHRNFVKDLVEDMEEDSTYFKQMLLKMPVIHSRYRELTQDDFINKEPYMRGYRGSYECEFFEKPEIISHQNILELDVRSEKYLNKIIDLADESNTELIFVVSPYCVNEKEQKRFNRISQIAEEEGIPMINFNYLYEEIGLDFSSDFRDVDHVNNYGAEKVTSYLADFIIEKYNLTSHKGEKDYEMWDLNSRYLSGKRNKKDLTDAIEVNEYLSQIIDMKDYIVMLSLNGNHTAAGDVYYEGLEKIGISYEQYLEGGMWILEKGEISCHLPGKEYTHILKKYNITLSSQVTTLEDEEEKQNVEIMIDNLNHAFVENGLNVVIYDPVIDSVIDNAGTDIYLNFNMQRND